MFLKSKQDFLYVPQSQRSGSMLCGPKAEGSGQISHPRRAWQAPSEPSTPITWGLSPFSVGLPLALWGSWNHHPTPTSLSLLLMSLHSPVTFYCPGKSLHVPKCEITACVTETHLGLVVLEANTWTEVAEDNSQGQRLEYREDGPWPGAWNSVRAQRREGEGVGGKPAALGPWSPGPPRALQPWSPAALEPWSPGGLVPSSPGALVP